MVNKNSPIFMACRPSGIIAILLAFGIAILLSNNASAANVIVNGGFETGNWSGWSHSGTGSYSGNAIIDSPDEGYIDVPFPPWQIPYSYGDLYYHVKMWAHTCSCFSTIRQTNLDFTTIETLNYDIVSGSSLSGGADFKINVGVNGVSEVCIYTTESISVGSKELDMTDYRTSGYDYIEFYLKNANSGQFGSIRLDNIFTEGNPPAILLEFDKTPYYEYNDSTISWDLSDYYNTHANELFQLHVNTKNTSRGPNFTQIWTMHYSQGDLPTGSWNNQLYSLLDDNVSGEYSAKIWYRYNDPVYTAGYIMDSYISTDIFSDNFTYVPPPPEEPPDDPDIPDPINDTIPEPDPDVPDDPPDGPGANQTVNVTFTDGYYTLVNGTIGGLCSPVYNFTVWSLSPVTMLNSTVSGFNSDLNDSFTSVSTSLSVIIGPLACIFDALPSKIISAISYFLVLLVLLLILGR